MILTLVACGSKPSDNNNNTDSTAFPTKTMTIVCPYGAGGGTSQYTVDIAASLKAKGVTEHCCICRLFCLL